MHSAIHKKIPYWNPRALILSSLSGCLQWHLILHNFWSSTLYGRTYLLVALPSDCMCVCVWGRNYNYGTWVELCPLFVCAIFRVSSGGNILYAAIIVNPAVLSVCVLCMCCVSVVSSLPGYQLALQSSLSVIEQVAMYYVLVYITDGMTQQINKCYV